MEARHNARPQDGGPEEIHALLAADGAAADADDMGAFWEEHLRAGLLLYTAATGLAALYLLLTPDGPHRVVEWVMVAVSSVATATVVVLPRKALVASPHRIVFFVAWSAFSCAFTSLVAALDGGLGSPLALFVFLPIVYASLAYPVRAVLSIGAVGAVAATAAALASGDTFAHTEVFVGTIAMVTLLCGSVTRARRAQVVTRRRLTEQLVDLATHDGLTGCLNHRTFYDAVEAELARAIRHHHAISLLVVDVDGFKAINDQFGHLAGDDVLRRIGAELMATARATDVVGRIGGDEFAILLIETDRAATQVAATRLAEAVAHIEAPTPIHISVGMAHLDHPTAEDTARRLVALADARLYERKHLVSRDQRPAPRGHPVR
jgi:diguanylate cyclase (GGDEF)-like protein